MDYVINSFDETTGQLTVTFGGSLTYAVDIPLDENGLYIVGEQLDAYIQGFAPVQFIERKNKIAAGIANVDAIKAIAPNAPSPHVTLTQEEIDNQKMWADYEYESKLAKALIKFGLLQSDPTTIPVSVQ